ncbi:unannotated protein [freshwater metagenome]|uniref:Unannotated protein n=1 Tax=freshwater metagenome TaxID=449393 RepID=A0A6J6RE01_9ZZZZ
MLRCPENTNATTQTTAKGTAAPPPKISIPRMVQASGVFEAPANTATNPNPASSEGSMFSGVASATPSVAPMANSGVTSPPGKSVPIEIAANRIFSAKTANDRRSPARALSIMPSDMPR